MVMVKEKKPPELDLTDRQREVVGLIEQGLSNNEIANELGISTRTVKAHTDAIRVRHQIGKRRLIVPELRKAGVID
jgi:DNA-binding NarL/FixJ family response regulator